MKATQFSRLLADAVENGLGAAALVDRDGNAVDLAGAITEEEAMPLAALVMYRLKSDNLASRLFAGEIISLTLDDRDVAVGVAKRQLFVVAVLGASTRATLALVRDLRGGALYDATYGKRMKGVGPQADLLRRRFEVARRRLGLLARPAPLEHGLFSAPARSGDQASLF